MTVYELTFLCFAAICQTTPDMKKHDGDLFLEKATCEVIARALYLSAGVQSLCTFRSEVK